MATVLVAADGKWVRDQVRTALAASDTTVLEVTKGQDVRTAVAEYAPELVILDMQIANMGGVAVAIDLHLEAEAGRVPEAKILLLLDREHDRNGTVCLCLTQEEFDAMGDRLQRVGFPESGTLLEEYNELAYDECKRLAALDPDDFVDDECLDYYEAGEWLKDIYFARGDWANGAPPEFTCYE